MKLEQLYSREKELIDKIHSLNGDYSLVLGLARQLEEVREQIKKAEQQTSTN